MAPIAMAIPPVQIGHRSRHYDVEVEIAQHHFWSFFLSFDLCINVEKLLGGGGCVHLEDYSISSGPFFYHEFQI